MIAMRNIVMTVRRRVDDSAMTLSRRSRTMCYEAPMADRYRSSGRERMVAIAGVALVHLAFALLLSGLAPRLAGSHEIALTTFAVAPPDPPPAPVEPAPMAATAASDSRAALANRLARPKPVSAPIVPIPPLAAMFAPPVAADDTAPTAGAAPLPGPETGAGGSGAGLGDGVRGSGTGSGGSGARLIAGRITDRDYPRDARRDRLMGTVTVEFTVGTDGRATGCRVTQPSGIASLDTTTCTLIERRFRYAPARDAAGTSTTERRGWRQRWWLEGAAEPSPLD